MPSDTDYLDKGAAKTAPKAIKREVPEPAPTRQQAELEQREKSVSRGAPVSWRLHPDTKPAIERAADKYDVTQRDLVDFLLRAGLTMLSSGLVKLPVKPDDQTYTIEPQAIPDEFAG